MPGGKYVRAIPALASDGSDFEEEESVVSDDDREELEEACSDNSVEPLEENDCVVQRVRKVTRKRVDRRLVERLERMEKALFSTPERQLVAPIVPPWIAPQDRSLQNSGSQEVRTPSKPDYIGGIRWDIRPFPQAIPTSKLWTEWSRFKSNFEIATDLNNVSETSRGKLLYLLMGEQLQGLITAAKLCPSFDDPQCYSILTRNIGTYLRSLVDTTAEHEEFTRLKQESNESVVTFYARVVEKACMCGYGEDENRFIRSQILQGMSNRDVANAARTYNHDTQTVIQAATRAEAFNINAGPSKAEGIMEVANTSSNRQFGQKRFASRGWETRDRGGASGPPNRRRELQNRFVGKRNRCFRCDRPKHNGKPCPALYKSCNTCNERGHFSATCRKKRVVNQLDISKEDDEPLKNEQV